MPESLTELLHALDAAVDRGVDVTSLTDDIEALLESDPESSRITVHAYTGREVSRLWALGLIGDPRDFGWVPIAGRSIATGTGVSART